MRNTFPTIDRIGSVHSPTMVVLGTADSTVPPEQSRSVYAAAAQPDGLFELEGLDHGAVEIHAGDAAIRPVSGTISRWTSCPPA